MRITITRHATDRRRRIMESELLETLRHPERIIKRHGRCYVRGRIDRGVIEIVCEMTGTH